MNLRLSAEGLNAPVALPRTAKAGPVPAAARVGRRPVYFEGRGSVSSAVYRREALRHGMRVKGPAVIEEATSATLIPPGFAGEGGGDLGVLRTSMTSMASGLVRGCATWVSRVK